LQKIKADSTIEIRPDIYRDAVNDVDKILTDLLPYERETIEAAYWEGSKDMDKVYWQVDREHSDKQDYFTKTYN
jgi:CRISPR/Cas system type I-B associated protein Csh2 (Cas7 group RAMP superfamily)